jgi:hypothetical protein
VILNRYAALADELGERRAAAPARVARWPQRPDPFALFSHYPTASVGLDWVAAARDPGGVALATLLDLGVSRYGIGPRLIPREVVEAVHRALATGEQSMGSLLARLGGERDANILALMWLVKFGLAAVRG